MCTSNFDTKNVYSFFWTIYVEMLQNFTKPIQRQQRLVLLWSLIKIIMKSQEEGSKTPDHSKINQLNAKIRLIHLYANSNTCLIYVHPIVKYSISINPKPPK